MIRRGGSVGADLPAVCANGFVIHLADGIVHLTHAVDDILPHGKLYAHAVTVSPGNRADAAL